jgi:hypothetical protein
MNQPKSRFGLRVWLSKNKNEIQLYLILVSLDFLLGDPNRKEKWLIPLIVPMVVLGVQISFLVACAVVATLRREEEKFPISLRSTVAQAVVLLCYFLALYRNYEIRQHNERILYCVKEHRWDANLRAELPIIIRSCLAEETQSYSSSSDYDFY